MKKILLFVLLAIIVAIVAVYGYLLITAYII